MAAIVKRPAALLDVEEHAWFIFQDNEEAGLRFPLACDATFEQLLEAPHIGSARAIPPFAFWSLRFEPKRGEEIAVDLVKPRRGVTLSISSPPGKPE